MEDLSDYRKSYEKSQLLETTIPEDPINLFHRWFYETEQYSDIEEVNAMTVATFGMDGFPKSRVVLLKKFNEEILELNSIESEIPFQKVNFEDLNLETARVKDLIKLEFLFN
jgi:pyridoxine/pyridoxamine 5'-phosphate oxidase